MPFISKHVSFMKKAFFTLIALVISATSFAQLIANKTDKKVTFGLDLFSDFQLAPSENWDPRGFNQGVSFALTYNFPLGESTKHTVSIGLGMSSHNYFSYSRIKNPYTNDNFEYQNYRDTEGFKRYKVSPTYGEIPLELRFRIKDAVKIGVGFKVGIKLGAKTRYVGPDDEEGTLTDGSGVTVDNTILNINNVERLAYSVTLRAGWKWVSALAAYQISPVFAVGHEAPVFHPLSVGLTITPF